MGTPATKAALPMPVAPALCPWATAMCAWQEFGVPGGAPALVLHGGPGSALTPALVRCFDLAHWRVIGFDQRGCGASAPRGGIASNTRSTCRTTSKSCGTRCVPRWCVVGGSWGATLALAYAARHPQAVSGLLLRGLFVPKTEELRWFFHGARVLAPQAWEKLAALAPAEPRGTTCALGCSRVRARRARAAGARHAGVAGLGAGTGRHVHAATGGSAGRIDRYRDPGPLPRAWLLAWEPGTAAAARRLPRVPVRFLHGAGRRRLPTGRGTGRARPDPCQPVDLVPRRPRPTHAAMVRRDARDLALPAARKRRTREPAPEDQPDRRQRDRAAGALHHRAAARWRCGARCARRSSPPTA